jgi:hypothetical protein
MRYVLVQPTLRATQLALAPYSQPIGHSLPTTSLETLDSESPHPHPLAVEHTPPPANKTNPVSAQTLAKQYIL